MTDVRPWHRVGAYKYLENIGYSYENGVSMLVLRRSGQGEEFPDAEEGGQDSGMQTGEKAGRAKWRRNAPFWERTRGILIQRYNEIEREEENLLSKCTGFSALVEHGDRGVSWALENRGASALGPRKMRASLRSRARSWPRGVQPLFLLTCTNIF